jgi:hypothetical protein
VAPGGLPVPLKVNGPAGRRASGHGPRRHTPLLLLVSTLPLAVAGALTMTAARSWCGGTQWVARCPSYYQQPLNPEPEFARTASPGHGQFSGPEPIAFRLCAGTSVRCVHMRGRGRASAACSLKTPGSRFRHCQPGWVAARHPGDDPARMRSMNRSRIQVSSSPPELTVCMYITGILPASTLLCVA